MTQPEPEYRKNTITQRDPKTGRIVPQPPRVMEQPEGVDYRLIPLTNGQVSIVDIAYYDSLIKHSWYALYCPSSGTYYAERRAGKSGHLGMHRQILNAPEGIDVDHADNNPLNNRRYNLRLATTVQNCSNRKVNKNSLSGYRGVTIHSQSGKWQAKIQVNGKKKWIGFFATAEDAARAWNAVAIESYGAFAWLNTIPIHSPSCEESLDLMPCDQSDLLQVPGQSAVDRPGVLE